MKLCLNYLNSKGYFFIYGPFNVDGKFTSKGNETFNEWLKEQNENFGVRNIEDVIEEGKKNGLKFIEKIQMPANNFTLIFEKE